MPTKDPLEREKQTEYLGSLFKEIDLASFENKPARGVVKLGAPVNIDIPDIGANAPVGGPPPVGGLIPAPGAPKPPVPAPPIGGPVGPPPPLGAPGPLGGPKPPMPGGPIGPPPTLGGGASPLGGPGAPLPPPEELPGASNLGIPPEEDETLSKKKLSDKDKEEILDSISEIKEHLNNVRNEFEMSVMKDEVIEKIKGHYRSLEKELMDLKDKKIPERKFFDTEGTYRDNLYGMATRVLDEFLPDLFDEIPEYNFTATHVSRTFEDGTVADAIITLMATVPRGGMKYDFKVEIPVLNGLMQYPMYIQRGQKIIPLTKAEVQRELDSMSFRKMEVETPYEKENIFNNIGENIHRKPDTQKWYEVAPNTFKSVNVPPDHLLQIQRGKGIR